MRAINEFQKASCEEEATSDKAKFCSNTVFSLYYKIGTKNFTPQKPLAFRSTSCFGGTEIITPFWFLNKLWRFRNQLQVKHNLKPSQSVTDKTITFIIPIGLKQQTEETNFQGKTKVHFLQESFAGKLEFKNIAYNISSL